MWVLAIIFVIIGVALTIYRKKFPNRDRED